VAEFMLLLRKKIAKMRGWGIEILLGGKEK
jgi:hypothetical protein